MPFELDVKKTEEVQTEARTFMVSGQYIVLSAVYKMDIVNISNTMYKEGYRLAFVILDKATELNYSRFNQDYLLIFEKINDNKKQTSGNEVSLPDNVSLP